MPATLTAQMRSQFGKEKAKKIRRDGRVPAVIYGADQTPEHVTLDYHDLDVMSKHAHGQTVLVDLTITDEKGETRTEKVFLREIQRDPVTERVIHVDLLRVDMAKPVTVDVPLSGVGMPAGVKAGGLLEKLKRTVTVRCMPQNVPPQLDLDITGIELSHSLHVSEVPWPAGIEVLTDPHTALFTVLGKRGAEEEVAVAAVPGEETAAAEPEVIGRKKKEEESEEKK